MNKISVGRATSAGFRLIAREPAAFAVWCLAYFVSVLPTALVWPEMREMYAIVGDNTNLLTGPKFVAAQQKMAALQPLSMLMGLAVFVCIPAAATRALLFPADRRFFYLRIGMRELWFGLATLVVLFGWMAVIFATFLPAMLVAGISAIGGTTSRAIGALLALLLIPAAFGAGIWLFLRMSMSPVMSFAEREFRLPESWKLTRGHARRLFLVGVMLIVLVFALEGAALGLLVWFGGGSAFLSNPGATMSLITVPVMLVLMAVFSLVVVGLYVLGAAAWADAYRQLRPDLDETFA